MTAQKTWSPQGITARCKFCGSEGTPLPVLNLSTKKGKRDPYYAVACPRCHIHTVHGRTPEEGVENWNMQRYSVDTLRLMQDTELTEGGAINLLAGILESISEDFIRASLMEEVDPRDENRDMIRQCKRALGDYCGMGGIDYDVAIYALGKRVDEARQRCIKAWKKAIRAYLRKEDRDGGEEDVLAEDSRE